MFGKRFEQMLITFIENKFHVRTVDTSSKVYWLHHRVFTSSTEKFSLSSLWLKALVEQRGTTIKTYLIKYDGCVNVLQLSAKKGVMGKGDVCSLICASVCLGFQRSDGVCRDTWHSELESSDKMLQDVGRYGKKWQEEAACGKILKDAVDLFRSGWVV